MPQVANCALSGVGPHCNDWMRFYINTHQYVMADEFENKLTGKIHVKHGRRYIPFVVSIFISL